MSPEAKFNLHRIFGMLAVIAMIIVVALKGWNDIPWLYFVFAVILYSSAIVASFILRVEDFRLMMGYHLALIFLTIGMGIGFESAGAYAGVFFASVFLGLAIPFILLKE
jgi:hypothetical protein